MLKHLTAFIVLTCSTILLTNPEAKAQESFKKHLIGGGISFGSTKYENSDLPDRKSSSITFNPTYARYLNEHFAIGVMLGYSYSKSDIYEGGIETGKYDHYNFSPYVRFDIPLWQSKFGIYNNLGIQGTYGQIKYKLQTQENRTYYSHGVRVYYEPGLMFRLKSNVLLQGSMGSLISYNYSKSDNTTVQSLGLNGQYSGLNSFQLGINFLL
jgi:hypothetical protein